MNDIPVSYDSSHTVLEDNSIIFHLTSYDGDPDFTEEDIQSVTYFIDDSTNYGQLNIINANEGEIIYTPVDNWNGFDSLMYYVVDNGGLDNDGVNTSISATIVIKVEPVNDSPIIATFFPYPDTLIYSDIMGSGSSALSAMVLDIDSDSISFTWFDEDDNTTISINEYELEDSTAIDLINYIMTPGENNIRLIITDNGEINNSLIDSESQSDTMHTRIDIAFPRITSGDYQVFAEQDGARELLPINIHNGPIDSTINDMNNFIIALPPNLPIKWTNTNSIIVSDGNFIQIPPEISPDSSQLIFNILEDFNNSTSVTLFGLTITGLDSIIEPARARIIVDSNDQYSSANAMDNYSFWVGSPEIAVNTNNPSNNYMIKNNIHPDSSWFGEITISNGPIDSTFHKNDTISIKIPNEMQAQWGESISVSTPDKILYLSGANTKTISFLFLQNFLAEEEETILVDFVLNASSAPENLFLGGIGRNSVTYPDSTELLIGIADPDISSGLDQIFVLGDSPQFIQTITFAEDGFSPTLKGYPNIYIRIPDNIDTQWSEMMDTETVEILDQNNTIISVDDLELLFDNSIIKISLNPDYFAEFWTEVDTLFINNLLFSNFNNPTAGPENLYISVLGDNNYHDKDPKSIQIGRPKLFVENNQIFLHNDINRSIQKISIYDDSLAHTITHEKGIIIVLPDNYPATWVIPENIEYSGSYNGLIDSIIVKGINNDTLHIYITDDFVRGDSIIFSNLMLGNFSGTSYDENPFSLSVAGGAINFPFYESDTTGWIKTARPNISISNDFAVLLDNNSSVQVPALRIREDYYAPVINTQKQFITLSIPVETGMYWDTTVPITFITGSAIEKVSYQPIYNGRHVSFEILQNFLSTDSISISGLYFNAPTFEIDTVLAMSLNTGQTDCDWTKNEITVGSLNFSSVDPVTDEGADQFFFRNTVFNYRKLYPIMINQGSTDIISDKLIFRIPNGLEAKWDSLLTISQFNIFSVNGGSVYEEIEFSLNGKDLILKGVSFEANVDVKVDGLYFSADKNESLPLTVSSSDTLLLVLDGYINSLVMKDGYQKAIGGPIITSKHNTNLIVGEGEPFAQLDTIIIIEDESISGLAIFDSLHIAIPEIIGDTFSWSNNNELFINGVNSVPVRYTGNIASIPLDESITGTLSPGDTLEIWGLGFSQINHEHSGFSLSYDLISGLPTPLITDPKYIHSGEVFFDLIDDISYPLGIESQYIIPDIIIHDTTNIIDQRRAIVLTLSDELGALANWSLTNLAIQEQIPNINTVEINGDSLSISFEDILYNGKLTLEGLLLTTNEIFVTNPIDADSLVKHFILTDGHINLHTQRTDIGFNPFIVDSTSNAIQFFPPMILERPEVFYTENNIISFPSSPGLFDRETSLHPKQFQLVRSWSPYGDTLLFSNESESSVIIDYLEWTMYDTIQINNMPFVTINFSDEDLLKMNRWFDESEYYNNSFKSHISINKNNFINDDFVDQETRYTDTSTVNWLNYSPLDISFNQTDRIISHSDLPDFTLSLGTSDLNELEFSLIGVLSGLDTTIIFNSVDSSIIIGDYFPTLVEDLYIVYIGSAQNNLKGMTPIIRQFIVDNSLPEIVSIFPISGKSIDGGGHEVSILENISVSYFDNLFIENNNNIFNIKFGLSDTILYTKFPFPDSLLFSIDMDWSNGIDYSNHQSSHIKVERNHADTALWSVSFDSLLSLLSDDSMNYDMLSQINSFITFTLNDYTTLEDTRSAEYKILLTDSSPIGEEVFNYPNPFSSINGQNTTIRYTVHKDGMTGGEFLIFDAGGDVVYFNNKLNSDIGTHDDLIWDGTDFNGNRLSSGVYFGYLKTKNTHFKKIIISILNE